VRARDRVLLLVALVIAAVCVRLGLWQLERLSERRAWNSVVLSGLNQPAVPLDSLRGDAGEEQYRRTIVDGAYEPELELVLANRPRRGSPGVHILTPLRRAGTDTAVLVLRGWVYAPDATHAELGRWREDSARAQPGYVQQFDTSKVEGSAVLEDRILRRLSYDAAAAAVPFPLERYLVVLIDGADSVAGAPPRLETPSLGEGNHMSYAFQWFAFATIAVAGTLVFLRHSRRPRAAHIERFDPR
jgi:surfeit locus 1 family protein